MRNITIDFRRYWDKGMLIGLTIDGVKKQINRRTEIPYTEYELSREWIYEQIEEHYKKINS
jgi:hypothetical protein